MGVSPDTGDTPFRVVKSSLGASVHALKILGSGAKPRLGRRLANIRRYPARRIFSVASALEQFAKTTIQAARNYDESVAKNL